MGFNLAFKGLKPWLLRKQSPLCFHAARKSTHVQIQ